VVSVIVPEGDIKVAAGKIMETEKVSDQLETTEGWTEHRAWALTG
jgi:hypothetical protein